MHRLEEIDDSSLEDDDSSDSAEYNLQSLYGPLSVTMKQVYGIYKSNSSKLRFIVVLVFSFKNYHDLFIGHR